MNDRVLSKKTFFRTIKFSLYLFIIPITILVITFLMIIIIIYYSIVYSSIVCYFVIRYSVVRYSSIIVFIHINNIFVVAVTIKNREIFQKFIILPVMDINNRIFTYIRDWKRRKAFNKFFEQAIVKVDSS